MGCMFSKPDGSRNNSRIFRVYNVDENGDELISGKIQVSDSDLILFQKGKEEIRWPLRCLRRYGWDQELFSFESGRRCTTGPGIYAFKCRRAESLFSSVQECIQRAGQGDTATNHAFQHSRPSSLVVEPPTQPQHNGFVTQNTGNPTVRNLNPAGGETFYMNTRQTVNSDEDHNYYNEGAVRNMRQHSIPNGRADSNIPEAALIDFLHGKPPVSQMQYIELDLPASTENLCEETTEGRSQNLNHTRRTDSELEADGDGLTTDEIEEGSNCEVFDDPFEGGHQPAYINVGPGGTIKDENVNGGNPVRMRQPRNASLENTQPNYSNITPQPNLSASAAPPSVPAVREPGVLNYIEVVNLANGATSTTPTSPNTYVPFPDSPSKRTESYTVIDFAKTQALSNSSKVMSDAADDGLRKTRHNSTINS